MSIPVLDTSHIDAQSVIEKIEDRGTVKMKQSKKKLVLALFVCLFFTGFGILYTIYRGYTWFIWASIFFFGLGIILLSLKIISKSSYILLSPEGFSISSFNKSHPYKWTDVKGFEVITISSAKFIVFEFSDSYQSQSASEKILQSLLNVRYEGDIGGFLDEYNISPEKLADLLNTLQKHFHYSMWH
ncbi:MAG: STM3941 family protein [Candidatus Methanofastidiosia archaeon]|jgi:hypothetical protein